MLRICVNGLDVKACLKRAVEGCGKRFAGWKWLELARVSTRNDIWAFRLTIAHTFVKEICIVLCP